MDPAPPEFIACPAVQAGRDAKVANPPALFFLRFLSKQVLVLAIPAVAPSQKSTVTVFGRPSVSTTMMFNAPGSLNLYSSL